ncbi:hypothetical protein OE88DRAFT_1651838, partial [Heliocybe sulcata]
MGDLIPAAPSGRSIMLAQLNPAGFHLQAFSGFGCCIASILGNDSPFPGEESKALRTLPEL